MKCFVQYNKHLATQRTNKCLTQQQHTRSNALMHSTTTKAANLWECVRATTLTSKWKQSLFGWALCVTTTVCLSLWASTFTTALAWTAAWAGCAANCVAFMQQCVHCYTLLHTVTFVTSNKFVLQKLRQLYVKRGLLHLTSSCCNFEGHFKFTVRNCPLAFPKYVLKRA